MYQTDSKTQTWLVSQITFCKNKKNDIFKLLLVQIKKLFCPETAGVWDHINLPWPVSVLYNYCNSISFSKTVHI
jgi:hypothetical protein